MQPRETLYKATVDFHNELERIVKELCTTAPWYKRIFMDRLELMWIQNRRSVSVNLYDAILKLLDQAIENEYAIDSYARYTVNWTDHLIAERYVSFYCDDELEKAHRLFLRALAVYRREVEKFKTTT